MCELQRSSLDANEQLRFNQTFQNKIQKIKNSNQYQTRSPLNPNPWGNQRKNELQNYDYYEHEYMNWKKESKKKHDYQCVSVLEFFRVGFE